MPDLLCLCGHPCKDEHDDSGCMVVVGVNPQTNEAVYCECSLNAKLAVIAATSKVYLGCPHCNHKTSHHGGERGMGCWDAENDSPCDCTLTEAEALRAAQRRAAAVSILAMHNNASINIHCVGYYSALRDLGVLAENETPDDLIAEIRAQGEA